MKKNKFRIPKEFELYGKTIKTKFDPRLTKKRGYVGEAHFRGNRILLQTKDRETARENVEEYYCHEVIHHICEAAGECRLGASETRVNTLSRLLHQFLVTAKYH